MQIIVKRDPEREGAGLTHITLWFPQKSYSIHVLNRGKIPIRKEGVHEIVSDRHNLDPVREKLSSLDWHVIADFCAYTAEDIEGIFSVIPKERIHHYIYISTAVPLRYMQNPTISLLKRMNQNFADRSLNSVPLATMHTISGLPNWSSKKQCGEKAIPYTSIRPAFIYGKYNYAPRESYFFNKIIILLGGQEYVCQR